MKKATIEPVKAKSSKIIKKIEEKEEDSGTNPFGVKLRSTAKKTTFKAPIEKIEPENSMEEMKKKFDEKKKTAPNASNIISDTKKKDEATL